MNLSPRSGSSVATLLVLRTTPSNFNKLERAAPINQRPETAPTGNPFLYPLLARPSAESMAPTSLTYSFPVWIILLISLEGCSGGHILLEFHKIIEFHCQN